MAQMSGWCSPEISEDESMEIARTPEEEFNPVYSRKIVSGLQADQEKVLAVVKNNDIDEGANITSDFYILGCQLGTVLRSDTVGTVLKRSELFFLQKFRKMRNSTKNILNENNIL